MTRQLPDAVRHQSRLTSHYAESVNENLTARQLGKALRILRMKQLIERTNLSRATLYVLMTTDPTFPKKIKLTARSVGFLESDVDSWIAARAASCVVA